MTFWKESWARCFCFYSPCNSWASIASATRYTNLLSIWSATSCQLTRSAWPFQGLCFRICCYKDRKTSICSLFPAQLAARALALSSSPASFWFWHLRTADLLELSASAACSWSWPQAHWTRLKRSTKSPICSSPSTRYHRSLVIYALPALLYHLIVLISCHLSKATSSSFLPLTNKSWFASAQLFCELLSYHS